MRPCLSLPARVVGSILGPLVLVAAGCLGDGTLAGNDLGTADLQPAVEGTPCTTTCDCATGLACVSNRCVATAVPVYCCTNIGCPGGAVCEFKSGQVGHCGDALPDGGMMSMQDGMMMPPPDGMMPPRDGMMPPRDGMMPPRDGMMPPRDGMMPPPDGMMPPPDGMMPPPDGMMPPPDGMMPAPDGMMGPKACSTANDCTDACGQGAKGCTCSSSPMMGMICVPTCSATTDCPTSPMGQLQCRNGICAP